VNPSITDDDIRKMFNSARDGTINDAIKRHLCRIALDERCIADDQHPSKYRYPTPHERTEARTRLDAAKLRSA
jgi:hypothetical protein